MDAVLLISWIYTTVTGIWKKVNNYTKYRKGHSVAVYGNLEDTEALLEQLGDEGIAGEDAFVQADSYIFAGEEHDYFDLYHRMKRQIGDRKVCIRVNDLIGRESGDNVILYNDKQTATVKYWQKQLLYDDVCDCIRHLKEMKHGLRRKPDRKKKPSQNSSQNYVV